MAVNIGRVEWPGLVGVGAGLVKGAASFLDYGGRAAAVEVGSITRGLQRGNEGQVVWFYRKEKALRHNAGLPNPGMKTMAEELREVQDKIGVPWGLNVATSPGLVNTEVAVEDMVACVNLGFEGGLRPDWVTLNVSSPDTVDPVVRLSEPGRVEALIGGIKPVLEPSGTPLWLKLGLGLGRGIYGQLAEVILRTGVEAIIVSNAWADPKGLPGGWCGEPVRSRSLALVWEMVRLTQNKVPMVGAGGIRTRKHVQQFLDAGATAVMVVSGFLFEGRGVVEKINKK